MTMAETPTSRIAVIGAGTMGTQIALQSALHGVSVAIVEISAEQQRRSRETAESLLSRKTAKRELSSEAAAAVLARLDYTESPDSGVPAAQLVIEAIIEDLNAKRALFAELAQIAAPDTILATNSSTLTVSELTGDLATRERTLALHFFNPVLKMRLVEIGPAPYTDPTAVSRAAAFCRAIDREPIVLEREISGFIVNRILAAIRREAFWLASEGYASPQDIDRAVKLGLRHPMGPFELADFNGLDVVLAIARQRYERSGDPDDLPPKFLEELVAAGKLGRKTGSGFYDYQSDGEGSS